LIGVMITFSFGAAAGQGLPPGAVTGGAMNASTQQQAPRAFVLNAPSVEASLSLLIAETENGLTDPRLDSAARLQLEQNLLSFRTKLYDQRTNMLLWQNLNAAVLANNATKVHQGKAALAEYLTKKLSGIDGRPYPTGMSFEEVTGLYTSRAGVAAGTQPSTALNRRFLARAILLAAFGLPTVALIIQYLRTRKSKAL
jgi:hypothetical protein